ncbi:NtaA/DmoA family FMN-dependent monooxygenase [Kineococcus rhizosphaerae]|uniref:FMN-dependent oxidoreductase (Nitrilotriacetate monooxygenase family) n=1 Tax=Kineococcus rhizosphaerae TaxID=559628 RepID=A0A2T0QX91_9ACTN|nr:NtaA/DmoA family FMN-dependent monooxygenase [Kineococcus rhizosphaerae]PRY10496.1 FMN-dependent oxidoreductase (nitrilotriacetate monooxygenase family) [Kineococcus rhizosphaerae]
MTAAVKNLLLGVFQVAGPNGMSGASWPHPENHQVEFTDLSMWTSLARRVEEGGFDFLFLADSYGYATIGGEVPPVSIEEGTFARLDPLVLMSALAGVTTDLGLVTTTSTMFETPYANARRFTTLDHLSRGRMGWNVVTGSAQESAAAMFGRSLTPHDQRYDMADDYLDLSYSLFESWEDDAVLADRTTRRWADPAKVGRIAHDGPFHRAHGRYPAPPSPQRTPVVFQAGSSGRGREFAARHAEVVFLQGTTPEAVAAAVADIRARAVAHGRAPDAVRIVVGLSVFTGATAEVAQRRWDELDDLSSVEGAAARYAANTGIDLLALDPDSTLVDAVGEQGQSNIDRYRGLDGSRPPTVREILDEFRVRALRGLVLVGAGGDVADRMADYVAATDVDGFLLEPHLTPGTVDDVVEHVLPSLRARGLFGAAQRGVSLRERVFGHRHLPAAHPAARRRADALLTTR